MQPSHVKKNLKNTNKRGEIQMGSKEVLFKINDGTMQKNIGLLMS